MLNRLKYSVTFSDTGRTLAADVKFSAGYTAITGSNETGKTMIFEMARYLLFGVSALRGPSEDYKTLKAEGEFIIRENSVEIERTTKTAVMKRNGVVVATGTSPVNTKVLEELGFGQAVFDVACSINQGEVERLGAMLPAQRKALIDGVLGLQILDDISKWAMDEARTLDKQAESINTRVVPPGIAPAQPEHYQPSETMVANITQLRAESAELSTINGFLSVPVTKPVEPRCEVSETTAVLEPLAASAAASRRHVEMLKAQIGALPSEAPYTAVQLDVAEAMWAQYDAFQEAQRWLAANPRPKLVTVMQGKVFLDDWLALDNIAGRSKLMEKIGVLQAKGSKPCPHCGEEIALEADQIERLQAEHDALIVPADGKVPPTPPMDVQELHSQIARLQNYDAGKADKMVLVPPEERPSIPREKIPTLRLAIDQVLQRAALETELQGVPTGLPDYETMLMTRKAFEAACEAYDAALVAFTENQELRAAKEGRRQVLAFVPDALRQAEETYQAARDYETALSRHTELTDSYNGAQKAMKELQDQAVEYRKVRDAMVLLRGMIKQHVLPSLNRVASHLLRQMTGGQRNLIVVDDAFNVRVDQQNLETLSGSGKAVANLAIRIALGQVLTNKVLSILLADEIDASMDAFRAEKTSNVLRILEDSVSQILLVSHKPIEAPNHIRLGDTSDEHYDDRDAA